MTSRAIGFGGVARISGDERPAPSVTFPLATSVTKNLGGLDPAKKYAIIAVGAGPANLNIQTTGDTPEAVANGTAKYAAAKVYTAIPAAGGVLGVVEGVTGVKVIHIKNGAGTDDAPTVAKLGGRYQVKAVESAKVDGGLGAYTPVAAD